MSSCLQRLTSILLLLTVQICAIASPNVNALSPHSLRFIENNGQIVDQYGNARDDIRFRVFRDDVSLFLGKNRLHYQWVRPIDDTMVESYRMDVRLVGANEHPLILREEQLSYFERYYNHRSGEQGFTAAAYRKIIYKDVYPNIDWVFYTNRDGKLEHDFVVHPGGQVSDIRIEYDGASSLQINKDGSLTAVTPFGSLTESRPYSYQENGRVVESRFVVEGNTLSFVTGAYEGTLTIDPVLEWGTYFGGSGGDIAYDVTTDIWGNVYMVGQTASTSNIATSGAEFNVFNGGSSDAFVTKFSRDGDCIWGMYFGGEKQDIGMSISCDTVGYTYFAGFTTSTGGIATANSHQDMIASSSNDAFLVKLDSSGKRIWSTYFGGSSHDGDKAIVVAVSKAGNIYLAGNSSSKDGIALNSNYNSLHGGDSDAFLVKFSTNGIQLWGNYFGGANTDVPYSIAIDSNEDIAIVGSTQSPTGIATANAHRASIDGIPALRAAFLAKFDSLGGLHWGTYYGGKGTDIATTVTFDYNQNVIVGGITTSDTGISTPNCHQPTYSGLDEGFVAKFNSAGERLWGTYYGGTGNEWISGVAVGNDNIIYIAGRSPSTTGIATPDGYQPTKIVESGTQDAGILIKLDPNGSRLWGTYFAGSHRIRFNSVSIDDVNNVYLAGLTRSATHVAHGNAFQTALGGGDDAVLIRFNDCQAPAVPTISGPTHLCNGKPSQFYSSGVTGASHYTWLLPSGWTGTSTSDTINVTADTTEGIIRLVAHNACGRTSDTQSISVTVSKVPAISALPASDACSGDTITLKVVNQNGTGYTWLQDGTVSSGSDSQLLVTQSGIFQIVHNDGSCTDTSSPVEVRIHPLPMPVIGEDNGELFTTQLFSSYQWYYEGNLINGANDPTCEAKFEGRYQVEVTDSNGCVNISEEFDHYDKSGVQHWSQGEKIQIYPNPVSDQLYIRLDQAATVSIVAPDGKLALHTSVLNPGENVLATKSLPAGVYVVVVQSLKEGDLSYLKLIKL